MFRVIAVYLRQSDKKSLDLTLVKGTRYGEEV